MMVSPISAVRFTSASANPLEREGAFSRPKADVPADAPAKKSSKGKKFLKAAAFVAVVAAALAGLNKFGVTKVLGADVLKDAGIFKKLGHYAGIAGEYIAKYTIDPIAKVFGK